MFEIQLFMIRIHKYLLLSYFFYQMVLYFYVICIVIYHVSCCTVVTMFLNCVVYDRTSCKTVLGWWIILVKYVLIKNKNTAHTIVSWPNSKQWVIVHTSDLMMIIRQNIYILSIITREMGELKTHSPTYCIMDNWGNMPYLTHTLDKIYLTGIS